MTDYPKLTDERIAELRPTTKAVLAFVERELPETPIADVADVLLGLALMLAETAHGPQDVSRHMFLQSMRYAEKAGEIHRRPPGLTH